MLDRDKSQNEDEIEVKIPGEQGLLLSDSNCLVTPLSKVTTLIQDFNKYTSCAKKMGKATIPTALLSFGVLATSVYFISQDSNKSGLIILIAFSAVLTIASSVGACVYYREAGKSRFMDCVHLPDNYNAKNEEALNLIKEYSITIKDEEDPFQILNGLDKVKKIILKYEGTISQRQFAIKTSLVPTLFNSINHVTADSICEQIFEYAGLASPKNIK